MGIGCYHGVILTLNGIVIQPFLNDFSQLISIVFVGQVAIKIIKHLDVRNDLASILLQCLEIGSELLGKEVQSILPQSG